MSNETEQYWYFTFGQGHEHPNGYVRIKGTFGDARDEMFQRYGSRWAFQYTEDEFKPQIDAYGLTEVV